MISILLRRYSLFFTPYPSVQFSLFHHISITRTYKNPSRGRKEAPKEPTEPMIVWLTSDKSKNGNYIGAVV